MVGPSVYARRRWVLERDERWKYDTHRDFRPHKDLYNLLVLLAFFEKLAGGGCIRDFAEAGDVLMPQVPSQADIAYGTVRHPGQDRHGVIRNVHDSLVQPILNPTTFLHRPYFDSLFRQVLIYVLREPVGRERDFESITNADISGCRLVVVLIRNSEHRGNLKL